MTLAGSIKKHERLSLLIATVAVLLSQFPPIHQWFHAPELEIKIIPSFAIAPNLSNGLAISKSYSATNVGEKPGRIKSLYLFIVNMEGNILHETKAATYRLNTLGSFNEPQWERFTEVSLQPGENWSHHVSFFSRLRNSQLGAIKIVQEMINEERYAWEYEMEEQGYNLNDLDSNMPEFTIPKELSEKLQNAIKKTIKWFKEGQYQLYEVSLTGSEPMVIGYRFTIKKAHITQFANSLDRLTNEIDYPRIPYVIFDIEQDSETIPESIKERTRGGLRNLNKGDM